MWINACCVLVLSLWRIGILDNLSRTHGDAVGLPYDFLAKWLNRSGVTINAEWTECRFGSDTQGRTARLLSAISTLVMAVASTAFFFIEAGKFLALYIPISPQVSALLFFGIVMIYTVKSGFYGVVFTDLFQSLLICAIIGFITVKAFMIRTKEYLAQFATLGWREMTPA